MAVSSVAQDTSDSRSELGKVSGGPGAFGETHPESSPSTPTEHRVKFDVQDLDVAAQLAAGRDEDLSPAEAERIRQVYYYEVMLFRMSGALRKYFPRLGRGSTGTSCR